MAQILIADDSITMRMMVSRILQDEGWRVEAAANGEEALAQVQRARPDLVVTDLNMPVLNGLGFIQGLRAHPDLQTLPVLVLTTEDDTESKQSARALGVASWIYKPVDPALLVQQVRTYLPTRTIAPKELPHE